MDEPESDHLKLYSPSLNEIYTLTAELSEEILKKGIGVDVVVGISRGGLLPARLVSDFLDVRELEIIRIEYYKALGQKGERPNITRKAPEQLKGLNVLLVDDVADTGETLEEAVKHLKSIGASSVYVATLYVKPWNKFRVDFYRKVVGEWIVFPWERAETIRNLRNKYGEETYRLLKLPLHTQQNLKRILNKPKRSLE